MSEPDYGPIVIGEYVATWEPIPCVSGFLNGGVWIKAQWVIRRGEAFVATAESPGDVQRLVRFAQTLPKAA